MLQVDTVAGSCVSGVGGVTTISFTEGGTDGCIDEAIDGVCDEATEGCIDNVCDGAIDGCIDDVCDGATDGCTDADGAVDGVGDGAQVLLQPTCFGMVYDETS